MLVDQWFPFCDVGKTLEEMERAFDPVGKPLGLRSALRGTFVAAINVDRRDDAVLLTAEQPPDSARQRHEQRAPKRNPIRLGARTRCRTPPCGAGPREAGPIMLFMRCSTGLPVQIAGSPENLPIWGGFLV